MVVVGLVAGLGDEDGFGALVAGFEEESTTKYYF